MKRVTVLSCMVACYHIASAFNGRKGVSDDQLLAFTVSLIGVLLVIGFYREISGGIKQLWGILNQKGRHQ